MENDELKEITALLKASGMEVIPTIEVPFFRNPVQCGTPTEMGDEDTEMIEIPASLVKNGTTFVVVAKGDSMIGSGIYEGDQLTIHAMPTANDGDVKNK